jgi:hypothetical protein
VIERTWQNVKILLRIYAVRHLRRIDTGVATSSLSSGAICIPALAITHKLGVIVV